MSAAKPSNVVDLGHLGGGFSDAFGINNDASSIQVVGRSTRSDGFTHAFFWTAPRPMVDLRTFGGAATPGTSTTPMFPVGPGFDLPNDLKFFT
jgi:probable HAF family extracellular repeat protein